MRKLLGIPVGLMRASAHLLLLALSVSTLGPVLHGVHDADYDVTVIVHDESEHRFAAPQRDIDQSTAGDHCVACHFLRTSRGPVSWEPSGLHALDFSRPLIHSDWRLVAALSAPPRPSRSPPVTAG